MIQNTEPPKHRASLVLQVRLCKSQSWLISQVKHQNMWIVIFYVMRLASRGDSVRIYQGIQNQSVFQSGKMLSGIKDVFHDI